MHLGKRETSTHVGTQSTPQYFNTEGCMVAILYSGIAIISMLAVLYL